jgi:hypothetical protein
VSDLSRFFLYLAEIEYQPGKCKRKYGVIILRKNISVQKAEQVLFEEVRYFSTSPTARIKLKRLWRWPTVGATKRT